MVEVISQTKINKARKRYTCNACESILAGGSFSELIIQPDFKITPTEMRSLVEAKQNHYKIQKGEPYIKQFNKSEGQIYTFRCIPEIHEICIKYDLYGEN